MDTLGLERVVIVQPSCHGLDLRVTADALAQLGDRARGIAVIDSSIADAELDRLHACGFRGARVVTTVRGGVDPNEAPRLADRIARLGWKLQCLINGPLELEALAPKLRSLETPFIIDGLGRFGPDEPLDHPGFRTLMRLLETGNCWVKLSGEARRSRIGPPYPDMTPYALALIGVRDDRLIWGTDWPHVQGWDYPVPNDCDLLEWIYSMNLSDEAIRKILVDNPAHLFGFSQA